METLDYDEMHPNEEWMDNNIEGSSKTGNNPEWANTGESDVNKKINKESFKQLLDDYLKKLNDDYATERKHALNDVFVCLLPNDVFIDFLASKNKLGGQSKFPRVLKGDLLLDWKNFISIH